MNPNQRTPPSDSLRSDYNRPRRTTRDSSTTPTESSPWFDYHWTTTPRTTRTGTYGMGISPPPSPLGETENTTPGQNPLTEDPANYPMTGRYGIPTPSTSWTGINQWPLSSSLTTHRPCTNAAPRLGRAPWPGLANVLEDRTMSPSPPPVELSIYHPLQTMTPHRPQTPTPSSTAPTSPKMSRPPTPVELIPRTNEPLESSSSSRPEERRIPSTSTGPTSSGQNSPKSTGRSWASPEQRHGSLGEEMSRTRSPTASQGHESPWPSISPLTEGSRSMLLTLLPYPSDWSSMPTGRYGIPPQVKDYYTFDHKPLTSKAPWSTPSPVSYGRKDHGAPEQPHRFPFGYAPQPLPDEPPQYRWHGVYRGRGTSRLLAAAGGDHDMGAGGSGAPPEPTDAERLEQARELYHQEHLRADHLEQEVEKLRKGKGKEPGRDPLRCTGPRTDRFSILRPDNYKGPPDAGPTGIYSIERPPPMSDVKPLLMEKPEHFKGARDNIEHFLGDCKTYFEVFRRHYMQHPALMVVFATSLMRGTTQDWWVHLCDKYEYTPISNDEDEGDLPFDGGPRYCFPNWAKFADMVREQFRNPAIELVHEKKMGKLRMTGARLPLLPTDGARGQAGQSTRWPERPWSTSRSGAERNSPWLLLHHRQHRIQNTLHVYRMEDARHHHVRRAHQGWRLRTDPLRAPPRQPKATDEPEEPYRHQQQTSSRWRDKFVASQAEWPARWWQREVVHAQGSWRPDADRRAAQQADERGKVFQVPEERPPVEGLHREEGGASGKSYWGCSNGAAQGLSDEERGGKRVGRRVFDSTVTTKDLSPGVHVSSAGWSLSLGEDGTSFEDASSFIFTDILYNAHSDIPPPPPPPDEGRVFNTTSNIWLTRHATTSISHPVLESMNWYGTLTIYDANELSLDNDRSNASPNEAEQGAESPQEPTTEDVGTPGLLAKRPASSSSRVKALNKKSPTIATPIVTMPHQSRPSPGKFQAAVMHAQSDGAERALTKRPCSTARYLHGAPAALRVQRE